MSIPPTAPDRRRRVPTRRTVVQWVVVLGVALGLSVLVRSFAIQAFFIPSASMEPTLQVNDRILVDKFLFSWHHVHTGEVVVFRKPPRDTMCVDVGEADLVKRVIGLPGQRLYSLGNAVFVDGRPLAEPYLPADDQLGLPIPDATRSHPYVVPAGEFFVMGDDRVNSCDSRYWGPIRGSSIVGEVVLRWWHNGHPDLHGLGG